MLGWFYGYRKPMIGSASRKCRFSKACPRFASAYSQRPAPAGRVTCARGSLTNSERKTETSDFGTNNCHCGLGVREADFLTHPIKKRGCTERRCSPFVVSELGQWLLPIIFGRGPTAAVIHFFLVRKLFVAWIRANLKGLSNHPFGLDFVGLRTGREIYLFVHDVCTV